MIVNMIITMAMLIQAQEPVLWAPLLASAGPQRRGGRCGGLQKANLPSSETDASAQQQWCANMLQILAEPQLPCLATRTNAALPSIFVSDRCLGRRIELSAGRMTQPYGCGTSRTPKYCQCFGASICCSGTPALRDTDVLPKFQERVCLCEFRGHAGPASCLLSGLGQD